MASQNLFLIVFYAEEDLESILEGRSWLFRKQLILFDKLKESIERSKIWLATSPFWLKVGPYPPECSKKDLMHVIGSTFGGIMRSEIKGDYCRIRVMLNVQKSLYRRIFVVTNSQQKCWVPFKYENLAGFFFWVWVAMLYFEGLSGRS